MQKFENRRIQNFTGLTLALRAAAGLLFEPVDRFWKGTALENMIYHELRVYNLTQNKNRQISFYRTGSGVEIDFVIEIQKWQVSSNAHIVCLEVKMAKKWDRKWERPMRSLSTSDRIHVDLAMASPKATGMQELPIYTDLHLESYGNLRFSRQVEQPVFSKQTEIS